ncbi:MAG: type II secretion system protein [Gemmatimonadota bacterium]|nr:type II secretion system protein [Gemmatimonadota bacterium]
MRSRRAGYTLLEVAVVLVILAMAGAVAVPAFATLRPASAIDAASTQLIGAVQAARARALGSGRSAELVVDAARARVWLRPRDTTFTLDLPTDCQLRGPARAVLHVAPDGATRGQLPTVACGAARVRVAIDAVTGRTTLEALP